MRWTCHVIRMEGNRMPKQIMYGELKEGSRKQGRPRLRYKDSESQPQIDRHPTMPAGRVCLRQVTMEIAHLQGSCCLRRGPATASCCRTGQTL